MQDNENSLPVGYYIVKPESTGAPPCIHTEGSYMAECAVAFPFFAAFMAVLLFFFQALVIQQAVGNALLKTGRELSVLACKNEKAGKDTATSMLAQSLLQKNLGKQAAVKQFIRHGRWGISLMESDFSGSFIRLQADYEICLPVALFGKHRIKVTQKLVCRSWTGREAEENTDGEIVYITPAGTVYHKNRGCSYLNPSIKSADKKRIDKLRNESGGKYYPCRSCMKGSGMEMGSVYFTKYGDRYHTIKGCSRLKRTVYAVRLDKINGRNACSKCGKG